VRWVVRVFGPISSDEADEPHEGRQDTIVGVGSELPSKLLHVLVTMGSTQPVRNLLVRHHHVQPIHQPLQLRTAPVVFGLQPAPELQQKSARFK
jgi:hypothetical protein